MLVYLLSLLDDERDKIVFNEMYERYERRTLSIAMNILHNTHDTEDAVLAAWEKVLLHFSIAKEYASKSWPMFEKWLDIVVRNAAKDELRKRKRRPEPMEMWDVPSCANTEAESELNMMLDLLYSMPDELQDLMTKRIVLGYTFREIGKALGCSEDTAKRRFIKAMEIFRERMGVKAD